MKTPVLLSFLIISMAVFGQKRTSTRSVSTKQSTPKPAVKQTPRPSSSFSRPSTSPSRPSTSSPSYYEAPRPQRHQTRNPAPSTNNNSGRTPSTQTGSTGSTGASGSSSNTSPSVTNFYSQSAGTSPSTGYYTNSGPIVSVSGTGIEYMRIANATGGQYLIYSQKESAKAIEDVIRQYANDSADIVILVDVSGSMYNNVKDISKESDKIVQAMPIGSRLGGAVFKFSKHPKWFQFSDLNEDHYYALDLITSPRKYMSSESHYDAMLKAIHSNTWKNRKRMIITLTDEYVESGENFNPSSAVISAANANNIELHTIMLSY
jgi:hypothetical protein